MATDNIKISHSQRMEWIDLAKGIAIVLLILTHAIWGVGHDVFPSLDWFDNTVGTFQIPAFIVISGFFFNENRKWAHFLRNKAHSLLIPFLTFLIIALISHVAGTLWFLSCLFLTSVMGFAFITQCLLRLEKTFTEKHHCITLILFLALTLACGCICKNCHFDIFYQFPLFQQLTSSIGSAVTVLPFYVFGYLLRRHTSIAASPSSPRTAVALASLTALFIGTCRYLDFPVVTYALNRTEMPLAPMYLCGMAGSASLMLAAKLLKHLPAVSYLGRYSIVVMLTHPFLIIFFTRIEDLLFHTNLNGTYWTISSIMIILIEVPVIWFSKRHVPILFGLRENS